MTYNLADRLDYLGTRMKELNDNSLIYERAGYAPITIENFTPQRITVEQLAAYGIILITSKHYSFTFDYSDLSILGSRPQPKEGDKITTGGFVYEVFQMGDAVYTFTTSSRSRITVHAKQVE